MKLNFKGDIKALETGINILAGQFGYKIDREGFDVVIEHMPDSFIYVEKNKKQAVIRYSEKIHFFRALGLLVENMPKKEDFIITEQPQFTMNGAMFDVSQGNATIRVETIKEYLRRMAAMGLNMLMLYTEDSYAVKDEPYFGYMRAKYTYEELKECDDYADILGIEMIPCIQTLAHLADALRWPAYIEMKDDAETLLVGDERVYEFIDRIIATASSPFRTKRIHIGMDEAWHLGLGAYLGKNGLRSKFDIMNDHLLRVLDIVKKYNLEPMIWSDMYFRAASVNGDYYDTSAVIPQNVLEAFPAGVQLVYWDYYHDNEDFYTEFVERHRKFGSEPIFAGGIWTWTGFGPNWGKTFNTTNPALTTCKKQGIKEIFVTIWGDNGTESNVYTNLLGLQLFAEHGYSKELDTEKLKRRFKFCTGCDYDSFMALRYLDETPGAGKDNMENVNPSKFLMWQDIMTGLFDKNIEGLPLNEHYRKLTELLKTAVGRNGSFDFIFEFYAAICHVLSLKSEIGIRITNAYRDGDKLTLKNIINTELPELENRVKSLRKCHKEQWMIINKALGWDIIDMRYGSLLIRIRTAIESIQDYLDGKIACLEELEEERLSFSGKPGLVEYANFYGDIVSPSRIAARG